MGWLWIADGISAEGAKECSPEWSEAELRGSIHRILKPLPGGGGSAYRRDAEMSGHDHPPFFSSWRKAYWFALVLFALEVALLYAFTLRFS